MSYTSLTEAVHDLNLARTQLYKEEQARYKDGIMKQFEVAKLETEAAILREELGSTRNLLAKEEKIRATGERAHARKAASSDAEAATLREQLRSTQTLLAKQEEVHATCERAHAQKAASSDAEVAALRSQLHDQQRRTGAETGVWRVVNSQGEVAGLGKGMSWQLVKTSSEEKALVSLAPRLVATG